MVETTFDLNAELRAKAETNFLESFRKRMNDVLFGKFVKDVRTTKRMATAKIAEQTIKYKLKKYGDCKQYEADVGGNPNTIHSPIKQKLH